MLKQPDQSNAIAVGFRPKGTGHSKLADAAKKEFPTGSPSFKPELNDAPFAFEIPTREAEGVSRIREVQKLKDGIESWLEQQGLSAVHHGLYWKTADGREYSLGELHRMDGAC